jgi:hypothetical protein
MSFTVESKTREVFKKPEHIFNFLSNFHHFHGLLPEDKIENWECTETTCSFTLKGLAEVAIEIATTQKDKYIHYSTVQGAKFPFDLHVHIEPLGDHSECKVIMDVHLSAALKLFTQKPLENFANGLVDKIEETDF